MYWQRHLSLQTADVLANQNWFELRWMINVPCQTASWEWTGWVFRVNFLCSPGLGLTLALLFSPHWSGLYLPLPHSYPFPPPATEAESQLCCDSFQPEWSLMGLVLLDTPLGHGLNTKSLLSKAASVWKTYRGLELWDPDLWLRGLPVCKCWREPLTDWRCRELGRNHNVCGLFLSPPILPLPRPGRFPIPAL